MLSHKAVRRTVSPWFILSLVLISERVAKQYLQRSLATLVTILLVQVAPAAGQDNLLKANAPVSLTPIHGTQFEELPTTVAMTAANARGTYVTAVFEYRFEVYDATDGLVLLTSSVVASGDSNTTFSYNGPFDFSRRYQWRVRAELAGANGPWTSFSTFETSAEPAPPTANALSFTDISVVAGLAGPPAIPLGGHASAFADATGDGKPDLYITNHFNDPVADLFFVNQGNATFLESAASRGIADFDAGSHGAAFGDLDNDGDFDLVNGTTGTGDSGVANNIFRNDNGTFTDVTPASIRNREAGTRGVVTFDMDRDGDLDIFAVNGWLGEGDPSSERNELFRNDGNLQFTEISSGAAYTAKAGQGVTDTDYDGDGDIDLITGNRDGDMIILNNDGSGNFSLVDPGARGIIHRAYSGVTMADIDNDSDLDMVVVGLDSTGQTIGHLYRNIGAGSFTLVRNFNGIDGYMGGFVDFDHDGDLDLAFAGDDRVYLNEGLGEFSPGPSVPVSGIDDPRAIAFADIDDDGDMDFAIGVKRSRNWLVRNNVDGGRWIKIKLLSPQGQIGAFGARVSVFDAAVTGSTALAFRESRSNNGYLGQDDPTLHVGLGDVATVNVSVTFSDGTTRVVTNIASNQTVTIDGTVGGNALLYVSQHESK